METPSRAGWLRVALLAGVSYALIGVAFGALSGDADSRQMRVAWRLAAWAASAALFAAHVGLEIVRRRRSPVVAAFHVSLGAAFGAFGLAVAALMHAQRVDAQAALVRRLVFALVAWPAIVAPPAFLVALAAGSVIVRACRKAPAGG